MPQVTTSASNASDTGKQDLASSPGTDANGQTIVIAEVGGPTPSLVVRPPSLQKLAVRPPNPLELWDLRRSVPLLHRSYQSR
jgi:hypothetical protein